MAKGGLTCLAAWDVRGGPVGPASTWAATSNDLIPLNRGWV